MAERDSIIVAIELGTSRIAGIAGKKKDGNIQILAYAEEKTMSCVKRGIVYNIEKTTQCIRNVISKLQASLHLTISQVYVGVGGQSVRSVRNKVRKNMLTQTYITAEHVDSLRTESYEIPFADCELLENFPQGFLIDSNIVDDPVGVMGTNIEGEYLNVIARRQLKGNIETCFANTEVRIADTKLSAYELAENLLTEQEKRAGSVLVDLGAGTTTVVVYKNNILRHLVTLPIGMSNITQDLGALQIDENEAEQLKLEYGNAFIEDSEEMTEFLSQTYTTAYDKKVKVSEIQRIIEARLTEILANVKNQINNSNYDNQLLGGLVLTGGGANMKNIEKAFAHQNLKIDKIRIAHQLNQPIIKNSDVKTLSLENGMGNSIISLLISGEQNCVGETFNSQQNIFDNEQKQKEIAQRRDEAERQAKVEQEMLDKLEVYKDAMRKKITELEKQIREVGYNGKDSKLRKTSWMMAGDAEDVLDADYTKFVELLGRNEKNKQKLKEASDLSEKLMATVQQLRQTIKDEEKANSFPTRFKKWLTDIVESD